MSVFVIDKRKRPLMPCSEKRARKLLGSGRARVHRLIPFSIRLIDHEVAGCALQPVKIKIDPGSKFTGVAVVRESQVVDVDTVKSGFRCMYLIFLSWCIAVVKSARH